MVPIIPSPCTVHCPTSLIILQPARGLESMLSTQTILDPTALYIPRIQAEFTFEGL